MAVEGERRLKMRESDEAALAVAVETAKKRCRAVIDRIESLPSSSNITISCKKTLFRLADSEMSFLSRLSSSLPSIPNPITSLSINIGHLEAVIHILQQPFINGVSRVCKAVPLSPAVKSAQKTNSCSKGVHVDIVCTLNGNPVWFVVSDRNPKYISWNGLCGDKGLKKRIKQIVDMAQSSLTMRASSIILFFSNGLDDSVRVKLEDEFKATEFGMEFSNFDFGFSEELEGEWIDVLVRSYQQACILEIKVGVSNNVIPRIECGVDSFLDDFRQDLSDGHIDMNLGGSFCSLISRMKVCSLDVKYLESVQPENSSSEADLINFDTTALIALVSGISNGSTEKLLATPESELRRRFKSNFEFLITQVMSEIQNPLHVELGGVIFGKRGIICESVFSEFKELVSMCGGASEKLRADYLIKCLMIVPDNPSARIMSLPTTRKLALKNKVVFGTGDYWHAPTLTANMAFVRAISQTGMSLFTIEHRPRALTGD
ncbi:hypothetical protein F0562_025135 [Nyssa sinensis]|uniref:DUF1308 domain-containing protein n=1 Tax=Nyssa sinensis TaxID=561372 RepID=A0A5J5BF40_9ASTE|nr:hypothetical protein F0562_025135 [Nyssa sinensis]